MDFTVEKWRHHPYRDVLMTCVYSSNTDWPEHMAEVVIRGEEERGGKEIEQLKSARIAEAKDLLRKMMDKGKVRR